MKKILLGLFLSLCLLSNGYCVDEWSKADPQGSRGASDIDAYVAANNSALDRLNYDHIQGCVLSYASASTLTVEAGSLSLPNAGGTTVRYRRNPTSTTVAWTELDTGVEAISQTYYIYGVADTDATTFTVKISTNSSAPTSATYYRRLGSFYNDASGDITQVTNDSNYYEFGSWTTKSYNVVYQASADGYAIATPAYASVNGGTDYIYGYSDTSNPPTTERGRVRTTSDTTDIQGTIIFPVKKGNYWTVTKTGTRNYPTVYWIDANS
jgi:hypothetical protein